MLARGDTRVVKSICPMCHYGCGIEAHVSGEKLIKVTSFKEHPLNRLCVKAKGIVDLLYSPERVTHPLKKIDGSWREVSWDEALGTISTKLVSLREAYGAKTLVIYIGEPFIATHVGRVASRFCSLYGTPNFTTGASLCFAARGIGHGLSLGRRMLPLSPSYENSRCVVVWGYNPGQSNVGEAEKILAARKKGAKLVVIDPRTIPLARRSDIHVQIRPGTDCALALGLLHVIITEELYDSDFVDRWTVGFDQLREHVKIYSPEVVEKISWVPAETIRKLARMYASSEPATIAQGVSLDHCPNGVQTSWAISILIAITGNLDVPGGNIYYSSLRQTSLRVGSAVSLDEIIGAQYPIYNRFTSETTAMPVPEAIIRQKPYSVKALIVQGGNPVLTWPNANKVREALNRLDLLVVCDLFLTETAQLADVFLPAATFLEGKVLRSYSFQGLPLVVVGNKAVEPPGDCREDWQIWSEIGKVVSYADYFPWQSSDELFSSLLEPSGITLNQLERSLGGVLYRQPGQWRKYREEGLNTPSGKVEIFSTTMQDYGYDPLPTFIDSGAKLSDDYPLWLITGTRVEAFSNSRYRNIARLRRLAPEPLVEINTDTARDLGIADGDQVVVESPRGSIKLGARVTDDIHPKVVSLPCGWDEANANILTDDEECDSVSGYPALRAVLCRLVKA